jgi:predicted O-methyltransferase YrrM
MNTAKVLQKYEQLESQIDVHARKLNEIVKETGEDLEGSCFTYHRTTEWAPPLRNKRINLLAAAARSQRIFELGVNASHSLLLLLTGSSPETTIETLDIGEHVYVDKTFDYVRSLFPERTITLQKGDSRDILVSLTLQKGEKEQYDLIHMDGGHTADCVVSDILLLTQLLKKGGWFIVDDINDPFIAAQVTRLVRLGLYRPVAGQLPTELYQHVLLEKI